jgi:cytochrome P450
MHIDDKYFENAKEFIPERWEKKQDGFHFSAFGLGKRSCIGEFEVNVCANHVA